MANTIWIIDDDSSIRFVLQRALEQSGFKVKAFEDAEKLLDTLGDEAPDVLVSDISMPGMDGHALLKEVKFDFPDLPVIIMTAHSDIANAVESFQLGAFEYLPKPFDLDEAVALVQRAIRVSETQIASKPKEQPKENQLSTGANSSEIIGNAPAMQEVFRLIGRLSQTSINVLVTGESGTGKELVARAIHNHSPRKEKPFVALNMAAIPKDLIESELFGHEKGAFTGANIKRTGRFEQANNGTLFLDEIGDMPLDAQTRLLRVLQEHEFYRVGGHESIAVDVRVVAATHQNLKKLVEEGRFREDLYHRLHVISIRIPPLRARKEDIPQLMEHFMAYASSIHKVPVKKLHPDLLEQLVRYDWPGNVRQLNNVCQWLLLMSVGNEVLPADLPDEVKTELKKDKQLVRQAVSSAVAIAQQHEDAATSAIEETAVSNGSDLSHELDPPLLWGDSLKQHVKALLAQGESDILNETLPEFEKIHIEAALELTHGKRSEAAKLLGWGRNTLTRKVNELGLDV